MSPRKKTKETKEAKGESLSERLFEKDPKLEELYKKYGGPENWERTEDGGFKIPKEISDYINLKIHNRLMEKLPDPQWGYIPDYCPEDSKKELPFY